VLAVALVLFRQVVDEEEVHDEVVAEREFFHTRVWVAQGRQQLEASREILGRTHAIGSDYLQMAAQGERPVANLVEHGLFDIDRYFGEEKIGQRVHVVPPWLWR
jgi:hypothetical protein